jgi:GntR family transcriptional regulator, transcriptional repressor for pyruvate dehydrogenase complex
MLWSYQSDHIRICFAKGTDSSAVFLTRHTRVADDVVEQLRQRVAEQGLRPGDRLPSERELARQLGIGRTSLREGLRVLELIGFLEIRPGRGVYLKEGAAAPLDRLIRSWVSKQRGAIRDLIELREATETKAAWLAAERASAGDIAALSQVVEQLRAAAEANDTVRFVHADTQFHDLIARASGNGLLRRALASIADETAWYRAATAQLGRAALERSLADHEEIFRAVAAHDAPAAGQAMQRHIVHFPMDFQLLDSPLAAE